MSEQKYYREWAMMNRIVEKPSRDKLVAAYRHAVESGDESQCFASVIVARAYVMGLNKRAGMYAYDVGQSTLPRNASKLEKDSMLFQWTIIKSPDIAIAERLAENNKRIDESLARIRSKFM